jgi:undecaprenyl-diphosphatase
MSLLPGFILAFVQGVTEFIPVSSSGHLFLVQSYFGLQPSLALSILLHFATLGVVLYYFSRRLSYLLQNWSNIIIGSLPAALVAILFRHQIESLFSSLSFLPFLFLVTAALLLFARRFPPSDQPLTPQKSLIIGLFQAVAILPGVSRSGSTLFAAALLGLSPAQAFDYSFALFIPASLGSLILESRNLVTFELWQPQLILMLVFTFIIGLSAFKILRRTTLNRRNWIFSIYLLLLSIFLIVS